MASSETAVSCPPSARQGRPLPSRCARHPPPERGWAGNMEERTALLSLASHRLRGEGDHEVVEGGGLQWRPMPAKRAIKLIARRAIPLPFEPACLRRAEPSEPSEPGPQSGPYIRPFPSRCARHPPPERGWAGNMEERTTPLSLASHRLRGEGDHEVVEGGGLRWRPVPAKRAIKLIARRAIPPPFEPACQRQAEPSEPSEPGPQSGPYGRPLPSRCARHPPPERGWAGNMEERIAPLSLASHRLRGEGDHEVVEGGRPPMEAGARQAGTI